MVKKRRSKAPDRECSVMLGAAEASNPKGKGRCPGLDVPGAVEMLLKKERSRAKMKSEGGLVGACLGRKRGQKGKEGPLDHPRPEGQEGYRTWDRRIIINSLTRS